MTLVYGRNKLRNMSKATCRLFKKLIDPKCLSRLTWTGKGSKNGMSNVQFRKQNNILKILLKVLQIMDKNFTEKDLHDDIVYKVLKFGNRPTQ